MAAKTPSAASGGDPDSNDDRNRSSVESSRTPSTDASPPSSPLPQAERLKSARRLAKAKLAALTLEEKVSLLAAADFWRTQAIPAKGIPAAKTTDGPNGARGAVFVGGTKAALFPCGTSLAATWNKALLYRVGQQLGYEAQARSADILLGPVVCMHRHPTGGRNFEAFSEDPLLTGKLAAEYVKGVQQTGVAAAIKHFVVNDQETNRNTVNAVVGERALREIYLRPFEIAIREAAPWCVMSSYNKINGVHADANEFTLKTVLRGEWGFDGTVISDWDGVNSVVESIQAGCDIEFPHSTKWRYDKAVQAVKDGRLSEAAVDQAAENALTLVMRVKGDDLSPEAPEREDDRQDTRDLIREAGVQGLTLLKNEGGLLPLDPKTTTVAVIGPNANRAIAGGGGSASLNPYYTTLPLDSIRQAVAAATGGDAAAAAAAAARVTYAVGCLINKWLPVASPFCRTAEGAPGVTIDWYAGDRFEGAPVLRQTRPNTDLFLWDSAPLDRVGPAWSAVVRTQLTPKTTGRHTISFMSVGPGRLYIDGQEAVDLWNWTEPGEAMFDGSADCVRTVALEAGRAVELRVDITNELRPLSKQATTHVTHKFGGCRIGYKEEDRADYLQEAVDAARAADVAVVVVGVDNEWESEGYDRQTMALPLDGSQDRLVAAVLAANPRTVVVNQSGSPVAMPWADAVPAVLQGWYQGQEAGNALADVLFGAANPSGKLPCTFPRRIQDTPAYHNWPGENLEVTYGEGLYIGYRHYERVQVPPLFPFGHGLSYTAFDYGRPSISSKVLPPPAAGACATLDILMAVTNVGPVRGAETVQVYVRAHAARLPRPEKELVAFEKVFLEPGETTHVRVSLDKFAVGYYDTSLGRWIAEKGAFTALLGASSADIRQTIAFEVEESFTWIF